MRAAFSRIDAHSINRAAFVVLVSFFAYWMMLWIGGASYAWLCDAFLGRPDGKFFTWYEIVYPLFALVAAPIVMALTGLVDLLVVYASKRYLGQVVAHTAALAAATLAYFAWFNPQSIIEVSTLCFALGGVIAGACRGWLLGRVDFAEKW